MTSAQRCDASRPRDTAGAKASYVYVAVESAKTAPTTTFIELSFCVSRFVGGRSPSLRRGTATGRPAATDHTHSIVN